jgi:hypothetical protein
VQDRIWLVLFVEANLTKGYQLFKCICLDEEINITDEYGTTKEVIPVKFISATSSFIQDNFTLSFGGYRENDTSRGFVTADCKILKKGVHFIYKDKRWEISGKDNISIDNVAYTFIREKLMKAEEPISSKEIPVGEDDNFFLIGR